MVQQCSRQDLAMLEGIRLQRQPPSTASTSSTGMDAWLEKVCAIPSHSFSIARPDLFLFLKLLSERQQKRPGTTDMSA